MYKKPKDATQSGSIWDYVDGIKATLKENDSRIERIIHELEAQVMALDARLTEHEKHPVQSKSTARRKAVQKKAAETS